ncbi:MAG: hypothetical protein DRJ10_20725 [Bacteroidetes bacterium]|nr:MAG: hypothetical protein DRJ10_20725 [Bacteroidota bacterium]
MNIDFYKKLKLLFAHMRKIKLFFFILLLFATTLVFSQNSVGDKISWNAYTQIRGTTNFNNYHNFSLRRLKFWAKSTPEFSKHWSYKVQVIFMSGQNEVFFLQDIYGQYRWKNSSVRFGQFLPQFSLQRHQPDYLVPSMERARAVSFLIPGASLGGRDIGIQYNLTALNGSLKFNVGVFNGYGIKEYRFDNSGYMVSQNLSYEFNIKQSKIKFGYSVIYRDAQNTKFPLIISDSITYSGSDFRYSIYGIFTSKIIDFQAEYLSAKLEDGNADGYYGLLTIKPNDKNHIYLVYDAYKSDNSMINDNPWYLGGYNYFFKSYKIMLTLETGFQKSGNVYENRTILQLQLFFH